MPWGIWFALWLVMNIAWARAGGDLFLGWSIYCAAWVLAYLVFHEWTGAAIDAALAVVLFYIWWRRNRRKFAERVTGIVRDLGHRLAVVNVKPAEVPDA